MTQPTVSSLQDENRELLPCPFCGSSNIDAEGWMNSEGIQGPACDDCGACAGEVSKSTAENIVAWNTRAANICIAELESLNETLMQQRNFDPGAANVLSGFLQERDKWKVKAEDLEAQLRELQWKPITPDSLPKAGDEVYKQNERAWDKVVKEARKMYGFLHWQEKGWSHYRSINPPRSEREGEKP